MKKYYLSLLFALLVAGVGHAIVRSGNYPVSSINVVGETMSYTKVAVSTQTATLLSAASNSRAHLICFNADPAYKVYLGSSTGVVANTANSFELGVSTSPTSRFETYSTSEVDAIGQANPAAQGTMQVFCIEER